MMNRIDRVSEVIQANPEFAGGMADPVGGGVSGDRSVRREMERNGMEAGGAPAHGTTFADMLTKSVDTVNQYQLDADQAIRELVSGRTKNVHETMLAVERADTSLKMMMQVRNKILDAYREIMRMQV